MEVEAFWLFFYSEIVLNMMFGGVLNFGVGEVCAIIFFVVHHISASQGLCRKEDFKRDYKNALFKNG